MLNEIFDRCILDGFVDRTDSRPASSHVDESHLVHRLKPLINDVFEHHLWRLQSEEWSRPELGATSRFPRDRDLLCETLIGRIDDLLGIGNSGESIGLMLEQMIAAYAEIKFTMDSWSVSSKDINRLNGLLARYHALRVRVHGLSLPRNFDLSHAYRSSPAHGAMLDSSVLEYTDRSYGFQNLPKSTSFWDI